MTRLRLKKTTARKNKKGNSTSHYRMRQGIELTEEAQNLLTKRRTQWAETFPQGFIVISCFGAAFGIFSNYENYVGFAKLFKKFAATWRHFTHAAWEHVFGLFHIKLGPLESAQLTGSLFILAPMIAIYLLSPNKALDSRDYRDWSFKGFVPLFIVWATFKIPFLQALEDERAASGNFAVYGVTSTIALITINMAVFKVVKNQEYCKRLWLIVYFIVVIFVLNWSVDMLENFKVVMDKIKVA